MSLYPRESSLRKNTHQFSGEFRFAYKYIIIGGGTEVFSHPVLADFYFQCRWVPDKYIEDFSLNLRSIDPGSVD